MKLTATANHKALNREFKVLEIDLAAQRVKCDGHVDKGYCVLCELTGDEGCDLPWFRIGDVELTIKEI